jgi:hypothetical protein
MFFIEPKNSGILPGPFKQVCAEVQVLQILQRKQGRTYLADQSWITVGVIEIKLDDVAVLVTGDACPATAILASTP